jgi:simple sugar transport system permease protein
MTTRIALAAQGGLISERSEAFNIALEGSMLIGAFAATAVSHYTQSPLAGVLAAVLAGALVALIHAAVSVSLGANQIVSGVAINLAALGLTTIFARMYLRPGLVARVPALSVVPIPPLSQIPLVGPVFFRQTGITYALYVVAPALAFLLFRTTWGLALRATGEYPKASETAGLNVTVIRYVCVTTSGMLAALRGASLSVAQVKMFTEGMTAGRGFIALAAIILGRWNPLGTLAAAALFGAADALRLRVQVLNIGIPYRLIVALPYVLALAALVGFKGRSSAPAAIGVAYRREEG